MPDIVKAILLGIVEGLTEFIPVSSTGHLIVAGELLEFTGNFAKTFDIAIQLGAILAVVIVYRSQFTQYLKFKPNTKVYPNIYHMILTILPILGAGFFLHKYIKQYLFSPFTVAIGLILGSFIMLAADYYHRRRKYDREITYKQSFILGLFQCLALWPGMSRSGSTISGGLFLGMNHLKASSYSFIVAVPVMLCATGYELLKSATKISSHQFLLISVGFVVSFLFGWLSIVFFLRLIPRIRLLPFAIYRIIIAIIILCSSMSSIHADIALIQSPKPTLELKNNVNIEKSYFHAQSGTYLNLVTYSQKLNGNLDKYRALFLNNMFLRIKELPSYLHLGKKSQKKVLTEIITGGEKSYKLITTFITKPDKLKKYLQKLGISKKTGRIYLELCVEESGKPKTLWSYEYDLDTKVVTCIKNPGSLILAG